MIDIKQIVKILFLAALPIIITNLISPDSSQLPNQVLSVFFAFVFVITSWVMFKKAQHFNSEKFTGLIILVLTIRLIACASCILFCKVWFKALGIPFVICAASVYFYFLIIESAWAIGLSHRIESNKIDV